jgi:hypothetical protein
LLGIVCSTSHKEKIMTSTSTQDLQEEFLTSLRKGQKTIIGALRIWVDTVTTVTPRLLPLTDKLPKLPNVTVPFAGKLPTPEETVDSAYGLAEQLLANQRKFADDVLALTIPLMSGRHKNGTTRTAPKPEPKVVQVTPEPKPALVLGPKPAVAKPEPKPAAPKPEPKPAAVASAPKPAAVVPGPKPAVAKTEPKPAAAKTEPKPAAAKTEPKPAAVAPEPKPAPAKPAPAKSPAPRAAASRAAAPKTTAAKSAPRPAAKRTPKAAG